MCGPAAAIAGGIAGQPGQEGVGALVSGIGGFQAGKANAKTARMEGKMIMDDARSRAGALGNAANYDLGYGRAGVAASGFTGDTGIEALASKAASYGLDIDAILQQGRVGKAAKDFEAKQAKRGAVMSLAGGILGLVGGKAGGKLMEGFDSFSATRAPSPSFASMAGRGV